MFKHHKYCVIEASGLLVAVSDPDGVPCVYLLDGVSGSAGGCDVEKQVLSVASDKSKKVRITDPGLIEFVRQLLRRHDADCGALGWSAQIAGTVDMDGGEVQLSYVSQAFISGKNWQGENELLKYEPKN